MVVGLLGFSSWAITRRLVKKFLSCSNENGSSHHDKYDDIELCVDVSGALAKSVTGLGKDCRIYGFTSVRDEVSNWTAKKLSDLWTYIGEGLLKLDLGLCQKLLCGQVRIHYIINNGPHKKPGTFSPRNLSYHMIMLSYHINSLWYSYIIVRMEWKKGRGAIWWAREYII